jgi:hypothetical protein
MQLESKMKYHIVAGKRVLGTLKTRLEAEKAIDSYRSFGIDVKVKHDDDRDKNKR